MGICSKKAVLPFVGMMLMIFTQVSNMVVIKVAMSKGINKYVMIVYSDALMTLILLLLNCFLMVGRSSSEQDPPLTFSILCIFFLLALNGLLGQICSFVGIQYASPTLSTAMLNLVPAFTFILALIFRMEKLEWRSKSSQAKTLGTIVSIAGALVVTFYRGPKIITPLLLSQSNWILGAFFLAAEAFSISAWYIAQAWCFKKFPSVLMTVFYTFFFGTILSAMYSLIVVTDPNAWKLRLDMGLLAILYSAVIGSGLRAYLAAWCLSKTGPVYVSMFKPLAIVFSNIMGFFLLNEALTLGSVIGVVIIVAGFYAVMWGKIKEEKNSEDCSIVESISSYSPKVPLLQNRVKTVIDT